MSRRKADMTKDDYIRAETKRLRAIFVNLPQDSAAVAEKLIENAAFMAVSLRELQTAINEKGYVEEYHLWICVLCYLPSCLLQHF